MLRKFRYPFWMTQSSRVFQNGFGSCEISGWENKFLEDMLTPFVGGTCRGQLFRLCNGKTILTASARSCCPSKTSCGSTCFPGIPVTLIAGTFEPPSDPWRISSIMLWKKPRSYTDVKASPASGLLARCDFAWEVVIIGRERRSDASTSWSKWSL